MTKEQIIELWKSVGWNTLDDYHNYLNSVEDKLILEELHPDKTSPKIFWEASDYHFGTDPVCNHNKNYTRILDVREANYQNHQLALYTGMAGQTIGLATILYNTFGKIDIAEIGCGYNCIDSLYNEIENRYYTKTSYTGFDIIKRENTNLEIEGEDGTFSDEQVKKYTEVFNLFYSSNTFQHLSKKQIESYLKQVYTMLPYGGYFNMMYVDDVQRTYHYGQVIEMLPMRELISKVKEIGFDVEGSSKMKLPNSLTPCTLVLKK